MPSIPPEQALDVLHKAELLYPAEQIEAALDRMATAGAAVLENRNPLVLMVMNGAFATAAQLLARLRAIAGPLTVSAARRLSARYPLS